MIDYLSSQSFLEKQAREKLNMKKEGEQVVIIEPSKDATTTLPISALAEQSTSPGKSNRSQPGRNQILLNGLNIFLNKFYLQHNRWLLFLPRKSNQKTLATLKNKENRTRLT